MSAEQKQKAYEEEKKSWEEKRQRIETLAQKLRDRVRPFVEASKPGDKDDPETKRFAERMRDEARDLAMESFGVGEWGSFMPGYGESKDLKLTMLICANAELCHLLGEVYMAKCVFGLGRRPDYPLLTKGVQGDDLHPIAPQAVREPARPPRVVVARERKGHDP